jgi:hypothetical protein
MQKESDVRKFLEGLFGMPELIDQLGFDLQDQIVDDVEGDDLGNVA